MLLVCACDGEQEQAPPPLARVAVNEQAITDRVASAMAERDADLNVSHTVACIDSRLPDMAGMNLLSAF